MSHALKGDIAQLREQLKILTANQQLQLAATEELASAVRDLTAHVARIGNRTEFADVLRGLKAQGIINQADIDRISDLGADNEGSPE